LEVSDVMPDTAQLVQPAAELDATPPAFTSFSANQPPVFYKSATIAIIHSNLQNCPVILLFKTGS